MTSPASPLSLLPRALVVVTGLVSVVCLVTGWFIPPSLFNDLAAGWQVWLSMQAGAPFNCFWMPAATDLGRDVAIFQAWWSPGQYWVPGLFTRSGLSLGHAVVVAGVGANLAGVAGWWRLWRAWGLDSRLAAAAGLVVVTGRAFGAIAGMANIADALLFAAVPWAAVLAWHWRSLRAWQWPALGVVFAVAMFFKLSFLVAALALAGGLVAHAFSEAGGRFNRQVAILALKAGVLVVAVRWFWNWAYLSHGASIAGTHGPEFPGAGTLLMAWGGPLLSAFSGGNLLGRIFLHPSHPLVANFEALWPFTLLAVVLTGAVLWRLWRGAAPRPYAIQALVWVGAYGAVFSLLYATGAAVSLEERHYQPAGLALLPGVLAVVAALRARWLRGAAFAVIAGFSLYGLASIAVHARYRLHHGIASRHGFSHTDLTAGARDEIRRIDQLPGGRTLFLVTKVEIALEPERGRVLCLPVDSWNESFVRGFTFAGRVERLVLVVPEKDVANGKVEWLKAGLHGYSAWDARTVDGFVFLTGR